MAGSWYWIREWCESSSSSSIRMPVCRKTSTTAHVQKPRCSSKVRSRRLPPWGSSAQIRAVVVVFITARRRLTPAAVNTAPGAVALAACNTAAVLVRSLSTQALRAGRTGSRSLVRWSMRDLRCVRSFLCETSLALTGQRTAHGPQRAGSSSAHSAMSR